MIIKKSPNNPIASYEITGESAYLNRREWIRSAGITLGAGLISSALPAYVFSSDAEDNTGRALVSRANDDPSQGFYTDEALTPHDIVTSYNNFYEFGTDKADPKRYADKMTTDPWQVKVSGAAELTGDFALEDILKGQDLEDRIYRLRCVEAWSMVIPWVGFPLAGLIKRFKPTSKAKYVAFETLARRSEMRGMRSAFSTIDWPYREGLRMDEAMHPLTILAVGLYGKTLPNQNGAPLRLVVPWKYGFKSIKSIVGIHFSETQPATSWNLSAPGEYGFYSNVNPKVDHPRWSQKFERRLPSSLFSPNRIKTEMFNGYADQVASLYAGMNLSRHY